jgi:hypothetical protein
MILGILSFFATESSCDEDVYSNLVIIEGNVKTLEPETGRIFTPAGRQNLVFQRVDCKKCVHIAFTDQDGNYELLVGKGKYRLIVRENLANGGSALDPSQPEIVDAKDKTRRNVFDVKLIRHKNDFDITIP